MRKRFTLMITPPEFTAYLISGIWYDPKGEVSHYAVHKFLNPGVGGCRKLEKSTVIDLVEMSGKPFYIMGWDYNTGKFRQGQQIILVNNQTGKYLWTITKEQRTKNLKHLINVSWFEETKKIKP